MRKTASSISRLVLVLALCMASFIHLSSISMLVRMTRHDVNNVAMDVYRRLPRNAGSLSYCGLQRTARREQNWLRVLTEDQDSYTLEPT